MDIRDHLLLNPHVVYEDHVTKWNSASWFMEDGEKQERKLLKKKDHVSSFSSPFLKLGFHSWPFAWLHYIKQQRVTIEIDQHGGVKKKRKKRIPLQQSPLS